MMLLWFVPLLFIAAAVLLLLSYRITRRSHAELVESLAIRGAVEGCHGQRTART